MRPKATMFLKVLTYSCMLDVLVLVSNIPWNTMHNTVQLALDPDELVLGSLLWLWLLCLHAPGSCLAQISVSRPDVY